MKLLRIALLWIPRLIDRRTERFQSDLVNRHYEEAENMYRVMRSWRHGYRNHLQTAVSLALARFLPPGTALISCQRSEG